MDPVLALALLSLGAFVCVIATGLVYLWAVRPRLIEMEQNQTEPVGLSLKPQKAPPPRPPAPPTRLADIKGIGPVYEKVLQAAGVDT
ncbi:MAG: hypothetical protein K8I82_17085, partial [Anaerolineae bacterium]|nr:hypothetical protein [Anaerolineae bacterium]